MLKDIQSKQMHVSGLLQTIVFCAKDVFLSIANLVKISGVARNLRQGVCLSLIHI